MECIETMVEKLVSDPITEENLKEVENRAFKREAESKFTKELLLRKQSITDAIYFAESVDIQISLMKIIIRLIPSRTIKSYQYFGNLTYALNPKMTKKEIRKFLILFNNNYVPSISKEHFVIGCRINKFKTSVKSIELNEGEAFINKNYLKVYGSDHVVIIFFKSVNRIETNFNTLKIFATSNRTIEISFYEDKGFELIIRRLKDMFQEQLITESSISLEIELNVKELVPETKVTFSPETFQSKKSKTVKECSFNTEDDLNRCLEANSVSNIFESPKLKQLKSPNECLNSSIEPYQEPDKEIRSFKPVENQIKTINYKKDTMEVSSEFDSNDISDVNDQCESTGGNNENETFLSEDYVKRNRASVRKSGVINKNREKRNSLNRLKSFRYQKKRKNKGFESKNLTRTNLKHFHGSSIFNKELVKRVEKLYKSNLKYNKVLYEEMNSASKKERKRLLELIKSKTIILQCKYKDRKIE